MPGGRTAAWLELLRVSALCSVPGDALAGAAATGRAPNRGTLLAAGASLCLYEAGMALNDWADRDRDAVERPHRPLPSGRVSPRAALGTACALTAAGLGLAAAAGRPPLLCATALAGAVWAYDLRLKDSWAGPVAMGTARALDLCLGATATGRRAPATGALAPGAPAAGAGPRGALAPAGLLGLHTVAVTVVSRHEATGGPATAPLAALAATAAVTAAAARPAVRAVRRVPPGRVPADTGGTAPRTASRAVAAVGAACAAAYATGCARPYGHAALNPSAPLLQRATGAGVRAMIPLQAALAARTGAPWAGAAAPLLLALGRGARALSRKVSPT
ncbi:UbiA family prenyltransferase [Streptomyces sp. TRM 70351]|nr:UbiA family prenyltransferase [Streptomyces sp. TRM 70351]MEE1926957.1 UbiA family prenyltransferase [Streptomyces sp. TRM 70351]